MLIAKDEVGCHIRGEFDFTVDKFPLHGPDNMSTDLYGLFRSDTGKIVSRTSVTERYRPHTVDMVAGLAHAGTGVFEGDNIDVECNFLNGHYVTLLPTKEHRVNVYSGDGNGRDNVNPRIIISAGYDGKPYAASLGLFRDACSNMILLRTVRQTTVKFRHTQSLIGKSERLEEQFGDLRHGWDNMIAAINRMQNKEVELASFLESIYGKPSIESGRGLTIHENRTEAIFRRILKERKRTGNPVMIDYNKVVVTAWEAFNGVQGYVQHEATRKNGTNDFERGLLAGESKAVQLAERLAVAV